MGLNQPLPAEEQEGLCRTDCRLRPDVRALEEGDLEMAAQEKERLENKQRDYRKPFGKKAESEWWKPRWFMPIKDDYSKQDDWEFSGGYWSDQDGGQKNGTKNASNKQNVPDIF